MPSAHSPMDAHVPALRTGGSGRGEIKHAGDTTVKAMSLAVADTQTLDASQFKTEWTESFDSSVGRLSRVWGDVKIDTTLGAAIITSTAQGGWAPAGIMVPPTGAAAGNGYGLYTITAETSDRAGPGPFAALWPATDKWPGPERDIFEKASQSDTDGYSTVHWADASGNDRYQVYRYGGYAMNDPHTYQMEWAADHLSLFIDKTLIYSTNANLTADFAHGGQNAAFGAGMQPAWAAGQQTGGSNVLTVYEMSYASPVVPAAAPPPGMSVGSASIAEGGTLTFTVTLDAPSLGPVTVHYVTQDGTAKADSDYTAIDGTLTFAPNETSRTVSVQTSQDGVVEPDETLTLHLDSPSGANLGKADGTGTIVNDDVPNLAVSDAKIAEGGMLSFTLTLDAASSVPVTVKYATLDGTAKAAGDYTAASGVVTFAAGETSKTVMVQSAADATFEPDETLTLHLAEASGAVITKADGTGTIQNSGSPPNLAVSDAKIAEGGVLSFTLTLDAASSMPATVKYATLDGTAKAGSDYGAASGMVTFAAGETSKTVTVQSTVDATFEPDETLTLHLADATGAVIGKADGTGTIQNDDAPPSLKVAGVSATEGAPLAFTVTLSAASGSPVTVDYATVNGTATAGSDYTAGSGTLSFAANQTSQTVTVATIQDTAVEPNETFSLHLSQPAGATIAVADATGTILNDDVPPPSLKVGNASTTEGGVLTFTVSLSAASAKPVTVQYNTVNGTAAAPGDYAAKALTTLTFAAGETSKTVQVQTVQDPTVEANETLKLHLASPAGATLAVADGTGTISNNDVAGKTVTGTYLANTLTGTQYNDAITGGQGKDILTGGGGEDRFLFARYDGFDHIKDFTPGMDELVFKGLSAGAITAKAATYSGISGTDVSYGGTDHVFLEKVALASFSIAGDVVFA